MQTSHDWHSSVTTFQMYENVSPWQIVRTIAQRAHHPLKMPHRKQDKPCSVASMLVELRPLWHHILWCTTQALARNKERRLLKRGPLSPARSSTDSAICSILPSEVWQETGENSHDMAWHGADMSQHTLQWWSLISMHTVIVCKPSDAGVVCQNEFHQGHGIVLANILPGKFNIE
jgi:hypothetical protein